MIGFPSVGKSTLLTLLTSTKSQSAAYEFTTLRCIPGILVHNNTVIQLLDLPGIIEGASRGRGHGRQVISTARNSDLILMVLNCDSAELQRKLLSRELYNMGIRLNSQRPNISVRVKASGGVIVNSTCDLTQIDSKLVYEILKLHRIHNAEVLFHDDYSVDEFIDCIENNRKYIPCLYVVNKIDCSTMAEIHRLACFPNTVVISCTERLNFTFLLQMLWRLLNIIHIYTKPKGKKVDFNDPLILPRGSTVQAVCNSIHRDFVDRFKYALVWGVSVRFQPQRVGLHFVLHDDDVVALYTR
uniref:Developmentally-regulated GTP-binding protein 2 n=1 Tax=Lygus hesperus TaxID=30085 RepID=A0A0A9YYH8_LYGHE